MYLLALEVSPYKSFYEKMGGQVVGRKQIEIESIMYEELVYGWDKMLQGIYMTARFGKLLLASLNAEFDARLQQIHQNRPRVTFNLESYCLSDEWLLQLRPFCWCDKSNLIQFHD